MALAAVGLTASQAWLAWEIWKEQSGAEIPVETLGVHAQQLIPLWGLMAAKFMGSFAHGGMILGSMLYVVLWAISTWLSL